MEKTYSVTLVNGKFKLTPESALEYAKDIEQESADIDSTKTSYKECVLECHKILDELGIPTGDGVQCEDPECKSSLGHRLRSLRDKHTYNTIMLAQIKERRKLAFSLSPNSPSARFMHDYDELVQLIKEH